MKNQIKTLISVMISIIMLFTAIPLSYATGTNFSTILTANKNAVSRGDTVDVMIALGQFTNIVEGINSFMGSLEYDKTKLTIGSSQIVAQNGWDTPSYSNDKILTLKGSMITEQEIIIKMTFTVNSDAELGLTTIAIRDAEASNTENDFIGVDGTINIEIIEKSEGGDSEGGNPEGGNPEGGDPEEGDPEEGNPEEGNPEEGNPEEGNPEGGNPEGGDPEEGDAEGGDPEEENPEGGNPEGGDPEGGDPEGGDPEEGNPEEGNPEGGNPEGGNSEEGNPKEDNSEEIDDTVVDVIIPAAGIRNIGISLLIIALIITGIIFYKKYNNYKI